MSVIESDLNEAGGKGINIRKFADVNSVSVTASSVLVQFRRSGFGLEQCRGSRNGNTVDVETRSRVCHESAQADS